MPTSGLFRHRAVHIGVAAVLLGLALGWQFGLKPAMAKREVWDGTIKEVSRSWRWFRTPGRHVHSSQYRNYTHYWQVTCRDGKARTVEVPWHRWRQAKVGDPVRKVKGARWPELMTPEAQQQREMKAKAWEAIREGPKPAPGKTGSGGGQW